MLKVPNHTNVIQLYDFAIRGGHFVLVIERPEPTTDLFRFILKKINQGGTIELDMAKFLFRQILTAVMHCYASGVYHGDIKVENILLDLKTSRPILIDFGQGVDIDSNQYCRGLRGMFDVLKTIFSILRSSQYSTVGYRRTVCRRTARLEFHLKRRTTPGWKNELRTVSPHAKSVSCEDDFFGGIADFETYDSTSTACFVAYRVCATS